MRFDREKTIHQFDTRLVLFGPMLLFKLFCDLGYWGLVSWNSTVYQFNFNPVKFAVGLVCCVVLYFGIDHKRRKASTFLLYLFFLMQIIPITTIYALGNDDTVYYLSLIFTTLMCEIIVRVLDSDTRFGRQKTLSALLIVAFAALTVYTVVEMVRLYGRPSSTALNIYSVYEMRASAPTLGKLLNYLLRWTMAVFLPLWTAKSIVEKKYLWTALLCGIMMLVYLYTGQKTYLFAIPMVLGCTFWAKRDECYRELFFCFCIGFCILTFGCFFESNRDTGLFNQIYSLIGRRCMLDTANTKFKYFNYFSNYPKMGFYGIFPRWLIKIDSYYENVPYTYEIARIYYGAPSMNANTGFLAEGFMRFGHFGTVVIMLLFSLMLKLIDRFAERAGYPLAIGVFAYRVFALADSHLIDTLFFGEWLFLLLLLLFYSGEKKQKQGQERVFLLSPEQK